MTRISQNPKQLIIGIIVFCIGYIAGNIFEKKSYERALSDKIQEEVFSGLSASKMPKSLR